jgi:hypothetical protein
VAPVTGHVFVRLPRSSSYLPLLARKVIPVGSAVNTTHGAVDLTSQGAPGVGLQKGTFNGAAFIVAQPRSGETDLALIGGRPRSVCRVPVRTRAAVTAVSPTVLRTLHARAHGRFRTTGQYAAATIRGTVWTTTDTCDATTISDQKDIVHTRANQIPLAAPPLAKGESVSYRCNPHGLASVSREYCVLVLGRLLTFNDHGVAKHFALFDTGLGTLGPAVRNQLCVEPPGATATRCTDYPLTPPDPLGLRFSTVQCPPDQGPGDYAITFRLGGIQLAPPLIYRAPHINFQRGRCSSLLGQTSSGPRSAALDTNIKRVNDYSLPTAGVVPWMYADLGATGTPGAEQVRSVIYADSNGAPGAFVAATMPITIRPSSPTMPYRLSFAKAVHLNPGTYWLGLLTGGTTGVAAIRFFPVPSSAPTNANLFSAGPSDPFGPIASVGDAQLSLYAFYVVPNQTTTGSGP